MKLYLVRHARAVPRNEWDGADGLRPLSARGCEEAQVLAAALAAEKEPPTRIISAPSLRCQESMEPFVSRSGVALETDDRLERGEPVQRALELLPTVDEGPLLLCTHADVIAGLLEFLELRHPEPGTSVCRKGAYWVLDGEGYTPTRATYVEPSRRHSEPPRDLDARAGSVRAAALDLGSTSFNLLIADVSPDGQITPVIREKVMLRLGAVIANGGRIPREVAKVAVDTARELREVARREKVEHVYPIATAALRAARNGRKVADAIEKAVGSPVRVLSGEDEARAIFRAFHARLELGDERVLGLDLGGGSLELAVGQGGRIEHEASLELGAVRLHSELVRDDPMRRGDAKALRARVREELAPFKEACGDTLEGCRAIATGGTVRALARLEHEREAKRRASLAPHLSRDELLGLEKLLVGSSHDERLAMRGMKKSRADLVPTGAIILSTLAQELGLEGYAVCDWGLREGVLLEAQERDFRG